MAMRKAISGFSRANTGTPSKLGGRIARKLLNPWGNNFGHPLGRNAGNNAKTTSRNRVAGGRRVQLPDARIYGMDYPPNDPAMWPVMPDPSTGRRGKVPLSTVAKANKNNSAVNRAFLRTTGRS